MKKNYSLLIIGLLLTASAYSQNTFPSAGSAGIGTTVPNASSALEIKSTTQGILIPRMTKVKRDAIAAPAEGLMIYQTNSTPGFYYYDGTQWKAITQKTKGWLLTGNTGTDTAVNFIGTTDAVPLVFKVNNQKAGYLDSSSLSTSFGYKALLNFYDGYNSAFGYQALSSNATGSGNIAIGYRSLYTNTAGLDNTAVGTQSLYFNTQGSSNTAIGYAAMVTNTIGGHNTANGNSALYNNTSGNYNTAIGEEALKGNKTGSNNTASGTKALHNNSTGNGNTANGYSALYSNTIASYNTANGFNALYNNTTGSSNTAVGYEALYYDTTGTANTAIGSSALTSNKNGKDNTAIGASALLSNSSGNYNTATGVDALADNKASNNTATGYKALELNTTGTNNTANGNLALYQNNLGNSNTAIGDSSLYSNTSGNSNTANGYQALFANITGYHNTAIGDSALYASKTGTNNTAVGYKSLITNNGSGHTAVGAFADILSIAFNGTAIGYQAVVTADNQVRIGNSYVTSIGGYKGWTNLSDGRYKKNIKENVPGLVFINKLRPITFNLDVKAINNKLAGIRTTANSNSKKVNYPAEDKDAAAQQEKIVATGFVAQEVEKAAKDLGYEFDGVDPPKNSNDFYGLRYAEFVVPLVKAVQELDQNQNVKFKTQEEEIIALKKEIDELKVMIASNQSSANSQLLTNISSASLQQNIPNPFSNTTIINYILPQTYSSAKIIVVDKASRVLKELNISGSGKGSVNINASTLSSGAYNYSLYVDGRLIDTKQMILAK